MDREAFEDYVFPVVVFLVAIAAWEAVVRGFDIAAYVLPAPSAIAAEIISERADAPLK